MHRRIRSLAVPALLLCLAVVARGETAAGGGTTPDQAAQGTQWRDISLDDALKEATAKNSLVLVEFWAKHCGACGQMDLDLWSTPAGAELTKGLICLKFDTQSPAGQEMMMRYPVTGLPCSLFLQPDGTELDRVDGYTNREEYLRQARMLASGVDPLPVMEARMEARPDSLPLLLGVLERYLNRRRDADADTVYQRILRTDPSNAKGFSERAVRAMAKYAEYGKHDPAAAAGYWQYMVERFPSASSVGGGVDGAYKGWLSAGQSAKWLAWICDVLKKNPNQPYLQRAAVYTGLRAGFRAPCLAEAARSARRAGLQPAAFLDSVAVVLEKAPGQ